MISFKQRISCKAIALVMVLLMVVSMIPVTLIAYALDSANESPYKAQNFTAVYNAETDSVDMTWDEFTTEPYELWLCVDTLKTTQLDVAATKYSYSVVAGGEKIYSLLAFVDDADVEGVESDRIGVTSADTLTSISSFDAVEVENNLTITEIIAKLPTKAKVVTDIFSTPTEYGNSVQWNVEGTGYDQSEDGAQTIIVSGIVMLDNEKVQNRKKISLDCSVEVNVKAAVDVDISSNLDDSAPIEKKVGESLALTVEATGTAPKYQWYKKTAKETEGTAIDGATSATFTINSVALTDAAQYYCVIKGKNNPIVVSKIATVNVEKNNVELKLNISPPDGQIRPKSIEIEVLNVPADAKGTVTIKQGADEIYNVALDGSNGVIKYTFKASGLQNTYEFSAIYTGDEEKYNSDEVIGVPYDFTKGNFTITEVKDVPSYIKALKEFKVTPVTELDPSSNAVVKYTYAVSDPSVAQIDENGNVTTLKKGDFKITVTAVGNEDYNGDVFETEVIVVDYADRSGLSFNDDSIEKVYFSGFNYAGMEFTDTSPGAGDLVYSIVSAPSSDILIDQTGKIKYADSVDPFNKDMSDLIGDVVIKLTKQTDGVYKEIDAKYTLTIKIADQAALSFEEESINITYTADENGKALTTGQNVATGGSVNAPIVYSIISGSDVISLDPNDGSKFTAIKPGTAIVKAEKAGNTFFNKVSDTYTIVVEKGTVVGFDFDETNVENLKTQYGVRFTNKAGVKNYGQSNSSEAVSYKITSVSEEIKEYAKVDATGIVYFDGNYALAEDSSEYSITIEAIKAENEYYVSCPIEYTLKVTRDDVDYTKDFTVNGAVIKNAKELTSPEGWYNASYYDKDNDDVIIKPDGTKYTAISEDGKEFLPQITRDADAKYSISFYLKNEETGAVSFFTGQKVNYDKTTATVDKKLGENQSFWSKLLETITFGLWHNTDVNLTVTAKDELSGIYSISYYEDINPTVSYKNSTEIENAGFAWNECQVEDSEKGLNELTKTINVSVDKGKNKKSVVYVKVVDCAGNIEYFVSSGMILDKVDPKQETTLPDPIIEIKLDKNTSEGLYNSDVPFTLTVNDDQTDSVASGIKDITVTIKGSEDEEYEKTIKITANKSEINSFDSANIDSDEFTVDGTFVVPADFDSNYLTILVEAEDYAGNIYTNENEITRLAIDNTKPVIEVSYEDDENTFSNKRYIGNNKNRVANIHITELNFDKSAVVINVTKDGKKVDIKPNFKKANGEVDENGDQIGWEMSIDYATLGEGDFTFDITYIDKAENPNDGWKGDNISVNKKFTIDNTKPIIDVVITNKEVQNGKYFSSNRKAIVTIVERNFSKNYKFDWSSITLELDGKTLTPPTPKLTGNNKNTYVREYEVEFTAEGDYTFGVKYTDLADNLADKYSCSSVAYEEFTIDKTDPELEITGVANNSANKGDVAPVVKYSDINFDEDNVEIRLTGAKNTSPKVSGKYTAKNKQGHTYKYNNFEKVQDLDDIYTLHAELTDKAGNSTEKTITFSVNRFGSVYNLSMIKQNISRYLSEEKDIVFTETNVDALDRKNIRLKLIKNGTPIDLVEGTDYTIEESGGNGKAYVYKYIIKKSLFANDGKYSIVVYSKDAAGNINENDDETKKAEISFGIDKTKPVVVPIDFESGVQYAVDKKVVSIDIKDNLVLEDVKIYLNDKEVTDVKVDGENYTFEVAKSNAKQTVKIVAVDAAENEQVIEIADFLVNANIFVRWFNNTPLFIGTIIGFVVLILGSVAFVLFGKKRKQEK